MVHPHAAGYSCGKLRSSCRDVPGETVGEMAILDSRRVPRRPAPSATANSPSSPPTRSLLACAESCVFLIASGCIEIFLRRDDPKVLLANRGKMAILDSRSAQRRLASPPLANSSSSSPTRSLVASPAQIRSGEMRLAEAIAGCREIIGMIDSRDRRQVPIDLHSGPRKHEPYCRR